MLGDSRYKAPPLGPHSRGGALNKRAHARRVGPQPFFRDPVSGPPGNVARSAATLAAVPAVPLHGDPDCFYEPDHGDQCDERHSDPQQACGQHVGDRPRTVIQPI